MGLLDLFKKKEFDEVGNPIGNDNPPIENQAQINDNQDENPNIRMLKYKAQKYGVVNYKYDLVLKNVGQRVTDVISTLAGIGRVNLLDIKQAIDNPPRVVKKYVSTTDAEALINALQQLGAEVELQPIKNGKYNVILKCVGVNKLNVIKIVKDSLSPIGLKESTDIVTNAPIVLKFDVSEDEANELVNMLKSVGADAYVYVEENDFVDNV